MNETIESGMTVRRGRPSNAEIVGEAMQDMKERLQHWAYRLELAAALRGGQGDSDSRHFEIAAQKEAIMLAVAAEMRAL